MNLLKFLTRLTILFIRAFINKDTEFRKKSNQFVRQADLTALSMNLSCLLCQVIVTIIFEKGNKPR